MARIELNEIKHSYHARPVSEDDFALKKIHTVWEDGGAYALLGPSGCGKTTMLNIISGLLKPSHGRILYDGKDVSAMQPEQRNIAQVFQFPVLYDTMTVFQNLAFPLKNRGVPKATVAKRVNEIATALDLTQDLNKRAAGLSADAKQKISLGRGLVRNDVAAILFDEPLTVIDPHLKWDLRRKLKEIHKEFKLTMIYVTHDQVEAMTFADQIVVMYKGEIVQTGTPEELFENPDHTFVGYFIGSPGMNFLECTVRDGMALVDDVAIPLTPDSAEKAAHQNGSLKIGIRPMYVGLHETAVDGGIPAHVEGVEDQGFCRIVTARFGENDVKARIKDNRSVPDGPCWLTFPPEKTKIYCDERLIK
ncbi:ATP-binding cassette domain-containing protein [Pseudodesulfovibrio sp. JC047]|uniref:ABC transporter ATP-binding protein n=1 Tax=Pseudodesulfovibrio sp. JC047 TaxID=2683199 RepID=UPI0013D10E65|nr:ABC transporter ATP-binding protein [Pseudodesulfovibrio sp. JC047]NDV18634.1 ATP-binding cassette domain-containing protein [Pseudodesulfovibrio sp. JC047]